MMTALVVDDDAAVGTIVRQWLTAVGYEVMTSQEFHDATSKLRTRHIDLVILDVRLGEFNGLHLAERARHYLPDIKIVMMSGWPDPVLKAEAARLGATYLDKPFTGTQLLVAVGCDLPGAMPVPPPESKPEQLVALPSNETR